MFKKGQRVECIDATGLANLIKGFRYTIISADTDNSIIKVADENGDRRWFLTYRFKAVVE